MVLVCVRSVVIGKLSGVYYLMLIMMSVLAVLGNVCVVCVFWMGLSFIPRMLGGVVFPVFL